MTDTSNAPELLPCPFCGGEALSHRKGSPEFDVGFVKCLGCFALTTYKAWNARPASATQLPAHAAKVLLENCPNPIFDRLKYPMMGEFNWSREISDENGDKVTEVLTVPWTTCKEIIAFTLRAIALDTTTATCDNTREGE